MRSIRIAVYMWIALAAARRICRKAMSPARNPKVDVEKEREKFWNSPAAQHWLSEEQRTVQTEIDRDILRQMCQAAKARHPRAKLNSDRYDAIVSSILATASKIEKSTVRGKADWAMFEADCARDYASNTLK